tara:strand:- start:73 stop:693 length:621 start_codon:yes stop_codon:yes gene_type:complete
MENKVLVFDDIIDLEYQEKIKNVLIGEETFNDYYFPWYFTQDVTNQKDKNSQKRSALTHQYVISEDDTNTVGTIDSVFHDLFIPLLNKACNKVDKQNISIIKGRSFLQLPINYKGKKEDTPHIDIIDSHFVMLYYVCDSDGDTIIYNEQKKSDNYTVQKRITPKQGRVVLFDGNFYHTAEQPTDNVRCVVNYDLTSKLVLEKKVLV